MSTERVDLILLAAVEFGPDYLYEVRNGGMGRTLTIDVGTKAKAKEVRPRVPIEWKGVYTMVLYHTPPLDRAEIKS